MLRSKCIYFLIMFNYLASLPPIYIVGDRLSVSNTMSLAWRYADIYMQQLLNIIQNYSYSSYGFKAIQAHISFPFPPWIIRTPYDKLRDIQNCNLVIWIDPSASKFPVHRNFPRTPFLSPTTDALTHLFLGPDARNPICTARKSAAIPSSTAWNPVWTHLL